MSEFTETDVLSPLTVTAVGSLPHTSPSSAVQLILDSLEGAPHPPQLPFADPREQMWIQFTEGLPRFRVNVETLSYSFDTSGDPFPEVEEFYSTVHGGHRGRFSRGF